MPGARSFDYLYESAATLEEVYAGIVDALVESATSEGSVLYAVPGSPAVAERTVELLRADPRVETVILPGVSFADLAFERLGVDPLAEGVRMVDGHRFVPEVAGSTGPLLVGQCDSASVLSEVKLASGQWWTGCRRADESADVTVLNHLGLPDEAVTVVAWEDLDRVVAPDHLTSLWVPRLAEPFAADFVRLEELARTLRARCPWDRVQTHQSLTRYLLEESYEALEAIEELGPDGAGYEHLEEELGDVLFQVVFHSVLGGRRGSVRPGRRGPERPRQARFQASSRFRRRRGRPPPKMSTGTGSRSSGRKKGERASWTTSRATCRRSFMPTKSREKPLLRVSTGKARRAPCPR